MTNAAQSGRFRVGGAFDVNRLGFGAMRVVGKGIWGPPADRAEVLKTLRRLPDLGVDLIDTADFYGPNFSEELIREALAPLWQDPYRDQGRPCAHRAEHLDSGRPAGISDPAGAYEPLAPRGRDDLLVAIAPHRPESAGKRAVRRHRLADQGQGHPLRWPVGGQRSARSRRPRKSSRSRRCRTATISSTARARPRSTIARRTASASSPGRRSTRALPRGRVRPSTPSPMRTRRARARSRSPGS